MFGDFKNTPTIPKNFLKIAIPSLTPKVVYLSFILLLFAGLLYFYPSNNDKIIQAQIHTWKASKIAKLRNVRFNGNKGGNGTQDIHIRT